MTDAGVHVQSSRRIVIAAVKSWLYAVSPGDLNSRWRGPGKVNGASAFRDTRLPVATVIENLEDLSVEEVMEQFDVTRSPPRRSMLTLLDHGTRKALQLRFPATRSAQPKARGWDKLNNGALLNVAEEATLDLLLTTERIIRYQQNLPDENSPWVF